MPAAIEVLAAADLMMERLLVFIGIAWRRFGKFRPRGNRRRKAKGKVQSFPGSKRLSDFCSEIENCKINHWNMIACIVPESKRGQQDLKKEIAENAQKGRITPAT